MNGTHLNRHHNVAFLLDKVMALPLSDFKLFMKWVNPYCNFEFQKPTRAQTLLFLKCLELNELECSNVIDYINKLKDGD